MTEAEMDEVIDRYSGMVYRLAFSHTRSAVDADDIFQEVFLRYVRRRPVLDGEEHRRAWLLRVTVNCCNKLWRSPWKRRTVPLEEADAPVEPPEESGLGEALEKLPPKYRDVVHLFYYEDLPVERIAGILRRPESTVRSQLTRARAGLRELMKEDTGDEGAL